LPLASLQPTGTATVSVFVDGLAYTDYFVVIQVGDAFEVATHDGYDGYVVADLAVPVTAGELPVWAVVYDEDGAPVKVALDTVEGLGSGDYLDVYLEAYQPHTYYWTQSNRVVSLPTSSFTKSGAELYVESNIYWDAQLTLNIGVDSLTPSVGGTVSWISFGTTDPSLSANTHVYALDTAGRASAHFTYGTVNTIGVPDYVTLKSPPALLSPAANQTVPVSGLGFSFTAAAGAQLHALSLTDAVTGDSTWTVWVPGGSSSIVLPQIPTGGLVRGRAYDWNVSSYFLPGFDLDSYLDDAFLLGITDSCSSENRRLTAQ
jgi:hypothetical protein